MISGDEFSALLTRNEDETLDFKEKNYDFSQPGTRVNFIKDVIAMANTPRNITAHVVLGVRWTPENGSELIGLDKQEEDKLFIDKLGTDKVSPVPKISYDAVCFEEKQFGVISIPVEKRGPFLPTKTINHMLNEAQIYVRRGSMNVAANSEEVRRVTSWFSEHPEPHSDRSEYWDTFMGVVHRFEAGRRYILIADPVRGQRPECINGFGLAPWSAVIDFDPDSENEGLLAGLESTLSSHRNLVRIVKGEQPSIYLDSGTSWFFAQGLAGRGRRTRTDSYKDWVRIHGQGLDEHVRRLAKAMNPAPISVVTVWNSPALLSHLRSTVYTIMKFLGDAAEICVITEDRTLVEKVCQEYDMQLIETSLRGLSPGLSDFFSTVAVGGKTRCAIPMASGAPMDIETEDRLWLEEELEILHLDIGGDGPDTPEQFRKGAPVSWRDLNLKHDCDREITHKLRRRVEQHVQERRTTRINLYHAPGAGGTTVARRVMWDLHRRFPCAVLHRSDPRVTVQRLAKIAALSEQGVLLLIDGAQHSEREIDELFKFVSGQHTPVTMLQVLRRFKPQRYTQRDFWLDAQLQPFEADHFCNAYSTVVPSKQVELRKLVSSADPRHRTAFYFGLQAFGKDFQGLSRYVQARLEALTGAQTKIVGFLAIAHHYAQQSLRAQCFAELAGIPRNRRLDLRSAVPETTLDLLVEVDPGVWRTSHDLIAEEVLMQLLSPQAKRRAELWRQELSEWAIDFAYFTRGEWQLPGDDMLELARRTFVYRDNVELLGTEASGRTQYSQIVEDIPSIHGKLELLQKVADIYPEEAHFHAHLGRFYSLNRRFGDAMKSIDRAVALQQKDPVLHHMRGMILRSRAKQLITRDAPLSEILEPAKEACKCFEEARMLNPESEHGYISEVELLLQVLDDAARGHRDVETWLFSAGTDCFLREAIDRAEVLLDRVQSHRGPGQPSQYESKCRARLSALYGDHSSALQLLDNLLARKDVPKLPIRRQIVWEMLNHRERDWGRMNEKEVQRCVKMLESNLEEDANDAATLALWLRAVRYHPYPPSLDRLIERVSYWRLNTGSEDAVFYLYVLQTLLALEGSTLARHDAEQALTECRRIAGFRWKPHRSIEWLGKGRGIRQLVHCSQLGEWKGGLGGFWERRDILARLKGRIASIDAPQKGSIEILTGQLAFFVPARADMQTGRDENREVQFFLGFSFEGLRAWDIKAVVS